jgi:hypothetical protein
MKGALYARISTNEQRKESIDDQLRECCGDEKIWPPPSTNTLTEISRSRRNSDP